MKRTLALVLFLLAGRGALAQDSYVKGTTALSTGDTASAITHLQAAVKAGQKAELANYSLGAIALARGQADEAIAYLSASLKIDDDNAKALKLLGDAWVQKRNIAAALPEYRRAEKLAPKDPELLASYGIALLGVDSVDTAIRVLTLAKEYDEKNPKVYRGLGDGYLKNNVIPLAVMNYQKAIELSPKDVGMRFKLAEVFERSRQYTDAVREYDGVISIDSTYAEAYRAKGKILVAAKLYPRAVPALTKYMLLKPSSAEGSVLLAKAYYGAEDFGEASQAAKRSLQLDSANADMWRIYAHSLVETKDYQTALLGFEGLKRKKGLEAQDQGKYGTALFGLGKEEEALEALLAAVQADSANCDPYYNLGSIYMKRQDYVKAAEMFEKKIACDPRSLGAYLNAAASYRQTKNYPRMRELLMKSLELKSDFLLGRIWLARYYAEVDSIELAKEQYDEVLRLAATNPEKYKKEAGEAHYLVANYHFQKGSFVQALESCKRAVGVGYDNSSVQLMWGQALLQLLDPKADQAANREKIDESMRHFRRAVDLEPNSAVAHLWLAQGIVLSRVEGDDATNKKLQEEACNEYRKVLKIDPRNEDAKKGMERIGCK